MVPYHHSRYSALVAGILVILIKPFRIPSQALDISSPSSQRTSPIHRSTNASMNSSTPSTNTVVYHSFKLYMLSTFAHQTLKTQPPNPKATHIHHNPPQLLSPKTPHQSNRASFNSSTYPHPTPRDTHTTRLPNSAMTLMTF